jgi:hypothetical protein
MILDYAHFSDVVTFETTFGTNKNIGPLIFSWAQSIYRNHHFFGDALLFDETYDSFRWLFKTSLATYQDVCMGKLHIIISWIVHLLYNVECCQTFISIEW